MSKIFSDNFLGVSKSSSRGLTDEPVLVVDVPDSPSVDELLEVFYNAVMVRLDRVEKLLEELKGGA